VSLPFAADCNEYKLKIVTPSTYTVLICTRNRCETLAVALESHLALEMPKGVTRDMIVVDNGSTDSTREVVEAFRDRAPFRVIYHCEGQPGHSVALNSGSRAATGDVIVFTDDDAIPDPGWLAAIHDTFVRHDADWVYGPVVPRWESGEPPAWYGRHSAQYVACLDRGPVEFVAREPWQHFAGVNHACVREKLLALGLYREDLGLLPAGRSAVGNDDELFYRALTAGCRVVYNPKVLVHHMIHPSRCHKQTHRTNIRLAARNQYDYLLANPPGIPTVFGLPRYYYRQPFRHALGWLWGVVKRDPSLRFNSELQLIRFLTLIGAALRHRGARRADAPPCPAPRQVAS
jgi:glycosyltransferase involved in cell wall biosynthesis